MIWGVRLADGAGMAVAPDGSIYIGAGTTRAPLAFRYLPVPSVEAFTIAKLSPDFEIEWAHRHHGVSALAMDSQGRIVAVGGVANCKNDRSWVATDQVIVEA